MSIISSTVSFEHLTIGGRSVPLRLLRVAGARRISLRVDLTKGEIRLSLPRRARVEDAVRLAEQHRDWIERRLGELPGPQPFRAGGGLPYRGTAHRIDWSPAYPREPHAVDGVIRLGGPEASLPARLTRWLKARALEDLEERSRALAARVDRPVSRVSVKDTTSRWGSCSAGGALSYSWRLILAPDAVRGAVAAHEVAHLVHLNHGPAFHALVAELLGRDPTPSRRWLAAHGASLHWIGREA